MVLMAITKLGKYSINKVWWSSLNLCAELFGRIATNVLI